MWSTRPNMKLHIVSGLRGVTICLKQCFLSCAGCSENVLLLIDKFSTRTYHYPGVLIGITDTQSLTLLRWAHTPGINKENVTTIAISYFRGKTC